MNIRLILRKFGIIFVIAGLLLFMCVPLWIVFVKSFQIKQIEIIGDNIDILIDEKKLTSNLYFFPIQKIISDITKDNPLISDIHITKKYPNTLVIQVIQQHPIAYLATDYGNVGLGIGGLVLPPPGKNVVLPVLHFVTGPVYKGHVLKNQQIIQALTFIQMVQQSEMFVSDISSYDSKSILARIDKSDILIPQDGNLVSLVSTLQTLIGGFRIKGIMPTRIDLRFDKPIISY